MIPQFRIAPTYSVLGSHTVLVIPSVNLMNSTLPSECSHSGNRLNTNRNADD